MSIDLSGSSSTRCCQICNRELHAHRQFESNSHRACFEAPYWIERHPLHPDHRLTILHHRQPYECDGCGEFSETSSTRNAFACDVCHFNLDISCALSTLSDQGCYGKGKTPEQISIPLHPHTLTSFSTRHDFVGDEDCVVCQEQVEGDGFMCLRSLCKFLIHKGCVPDLCYADGTKAPRLIHDHRLETFLGEDTGSRTCEICRSDTSLGEFIGCARCEVFIHRDCIQAPEIHGYPPHPDHKLVLFVSCPSDQKPRCGSCSCLWMSKLGYRCTSCEYFLDVECALKVLAYCKKGMSVKIELSWHEHPLILSHLTVYDWDYCFYCEDESDGPMYACKEQDCKFVLHKQCIGIEPTIIHPHHPDHPLSLGNGADGRNCEACCEMIDGLNFSCKLCKFYLHVKCATRVPTRKHYLHEHELLCLDEVPSLDCNRCGASTDSPLLRCVLCNFNLHEKCMEVPREVRNEVHWHPLTLHETYIEDNSGEYYCDRCEERRDDRLGVYVCEQCSARWAYHIECVLPELQKMYAKRDNTVAIETLAGEIARRDEEIHETERKLEEMRREVGELRKKHAALILDARPSLPS